MTLVRWDPSENERLLDELERQFSIGAPVVMPTDTLYGLCAPVGNEAAVRRIFDLKGRPLNMTLPIAVGDIDGLVSIAPVDGWRRDLIERDLPGPFTFIVKAGIDLPELVMRSGTVGIRVPDHPIWAALHRRFGPMALTSANRHGSPDILEAKGMDAELGGSIMVVEDDASLSGSPSEVIDLTGDAPVAIRAGKTK